MLASGLCLPFTRGMVQNAKVRAIKNPPHATLRGLRKASGMTLERVCDEVTRILGLPDGKRVQRGTLSLIESGQRGASQQMLDALAVAYGMDPGDLVTDFTPREWKASA